MTDHPAPLPNDQERQLVEWLADMNEDDALAPAKRRRLEDVEDPRRVLERGNVPRGMYLCHRCL